MFGFVETSCLRGSTPGEREAFRWVEALLLKLQSARLPRQAFTGAPGDIDTELARAVEEHDTHFRDALLAFGADTTEPKMAVQEDSDPKEEDLPKVASLQALKSDASLGPGLAEFLSLDKRVHIIIDGKGGVYLLSKNDDLTLAPWTLVAGTGSGSLGNATQKGAALAWDLPEGDKTVLVLMADEDPTSSTATLYNILRDLEPKTTGEIKLTSFGKALPVTTNGQHSYTFEFPKDTEGHAAKAWMPGRHGNPTAHNGLHGLMADADQGALRVTWKVTYEAVSNTLKPVKPIVLTGRRIALEKGCPVKVATGAPIQKS